MLAREEQARPAESYDRVDPLTAGHPLDAAQPTIRAGLKVAHLCVYGRKTIF